MVVPEFCSHSTAYLYFTESINSKKFVASKCERKKILFFYVSPYYAYRLGLCKNYTTVVMGEDVDRHTRGQFYLTTNAAPPFARG